MLLFLTDNKIQNHRKIIIVAFGTLILYCHDLVTLLLSELGLGQAMVEFSMLIKEHWNCCSDYK
jgi:hypothetical protein